MIPVLHLRSGDALYGAERALLAVAEATPAPYSPIIGAIVRPGDQGILSKAAEQRGLSALEFHTSNRLDFACARRVASAVKAHGVGLLHAHDFKSLTVALCASALSRIPTVATYHGETAATLKIRAYEALGRILGNFTDGAVAVSGPLQAKLRRWILAAPVHVVRNSAPEVAPISPAERIAARRTLGASTDQTVIAIIGRLSPEKGHRLLFDALRRLKRPPRTLVAGDGPLRESLAQAARGLPVELLGYRDDPRPLYAAADLLVIPSLEEALPIVALEAMALGVCVLASKVGDLPELLAGGVGYTVPRGNPAALAEALAWLCENEQARKEAGARGLESTRRRHSVRAVAELYAGWVYGRALGTSSDRSPADNHAS